MTRFAFVFRNALKATSIKVAKEIDQSRFQANVALFEQKISISGGFVEIGFIFEKFVVEKVFTKNTDGTRAFSRSKLAGNVDLSFFI